MEYFALLLLLGATLAAGKNSLLSGIGQNETEKETSATVSTDTKDNQTTNRPTSSPTVHSKLAPLNLSEVLSNVHEKTTDLAPTPVSAVENTNTSDENVKKDGEVPKLEQVDVPSSQMTSAPVPQPQPSDAAPKAQTKYMGLAETVRNAQPEMQSEGSGLPSIASMLATSMIELDKHARRLNQFQEGMSASMDNMMATQESKMRQLVDSELQRTQGDIRIEIQKEVAASEARLLEQVRNEILYQRDVETKQAGAIVELQHNTKQLLDVQNDRILETESKLNAQNLMNIELIKKQQNVEQQFEKKLLKLSSHRAMVDAGDSGNNVEAFTNAQITAIGKMANESHFYRIQNERLIEEITGKLTKIENATHVWEAKGNGSDGQSLEKKLGMEILDVKKQLVEIRKQQALFQEKEISYMHDLMKRMPMQESKEHAVCNDRVTSLENEQKSILAQQTDFVKRINDLEKNGMMKTTGRGRRNKHGEQEDDDDDHDDHDHDHDHDHDD